MLVGGTLLPAQAFFEPRTTHLLEKMIDPLSLVNLMAVSWNWSGLSVPVHPLERAPPRIS
jgi:hypothetical protein